MDTRDLRAIDAIVVTDLAGFIRAVNVEAATLLNVGTRCRRLRKLPLFFIKGRSQVLAALREGSVGPLCDEGAVIQPMSRGPVVVTVDVTREDDGLQWVLRRTGESDQG